MSHAFWACWKAAHSFSAVARRAARHLTMTVYTNLTCEADTNRDTDMFTLLRTHRITSIPTTTNYRIHQQSDTVHVFLMASAAPSGALISAVPLLLRACAYRVGCQIRRRRRLIYTHRNISDKGSRKALLSVFKPGERHVGHGSRVTRDRPPGLSLHSPRSSRCGRPYVCVPVQPCS